ncbi:hypothetical protein P344_05720 [Spiroplasma mirum ATCC 29335]|uniref:Uncharacterized protein n=1 Tax=Spiroplasma mirum ATCC 29335 TaxID=838561 RepID=W6AMP2_9MOLU|nr:hypothetical protein P344_05720 [Spiroplasma mirum ATCC 29335]
MGGEVALVSFLTWIDEPLVFIWIFLSSSLLVIHAVLTAIFAPRWSLEWEFG